MDEYVLLDARGATDPDSAIVLITGTAEECCEAANDGDYGEGCVVAKLETMEVMWEWFAEGEWIPDEE
jgi:hypothetical protein